jgi:hypothetical protein
METFSRIADNAAEKLLDDERLRSNFTDDEAKIVLDWAIAWLQAQVSAARDEIQAQQVAQKEFARLKQAVIQMNQLAAQPGALRLADAIRTFEAPLQAQSFDRLQVFKLLTVLTSAIWQMRANT